MYLLSFGSQTEDLSGNSMTSAWDCRCGGNFTVRLLRQFGVYWTTKAMPPTMAMNRQSGTSKRQKFLRLRAGGDGAPGSAGGTWPGNFLRRENRLSEEGPAA